MANTHRKRCSTSLSFRRMQTKTIMRYHLTFIRTALIKKNTSNKCWLGCSGKGTLLHCCVYAQSCPNLCDPVNCSPPGSSVHGILQARIMGWVAMPSSRDLHNPGIEPASLTSPALAGGFFTTSIIWGGHSMVMS